VIVTWNSSDVILDCLESLKANPPSAPWEAIVVDNGSTDGTVELVGRSAPWVRVIANRTNRGLAAANNQGMLAARGDLLLISNPDVRFEPGAVETLVDVMVRRPRAAWVVPRLRYPDGAIQTSAGDLPTLMDALAGRQVQRRRYRDRPTAGAWWESWSHDTERRIGRGHECAYLVRRAAVEEVGLQDEEYRLDWEGVDWTARFRDAGWEIWFTPAAEAIHQGGASVRKAPVRWIIGSHRGMYRYFAARKPAALRPFLVAVIAARAAAKLAAVAVGVPMYERAHRPDGSHTRTSGP
jgi:N-acetylglucosaminyl-diphospho-decaprenol L-rhamnosyltransferase